MADRFTIAHVRTAFAVWLKEIGGVSTEEARGKGWPITNTFRIEDLTITGEGRTRLRVVKMMNEQGGEACILGERHSSPKELCALLNAGIMTLEVKRRLPKPDPEQDRVVLPAFLELTPLSNDPNSLRYRDQDGRIWSSIMSKAGHNCAEVTCGRHFQAGYVLNSAEGIGHDPDWMKRPTVCVSHVLTGTGYHHMLAGSSEYRV